MLMVPTSNVSILVWWLTRNIYLNSFFDFLSLQKSLTQWTKKNHMSIFTLSKLINRKHRHNYRHSLICFWNNFVISSSIKVTILDWSCVLRFMIQTNNTKIIWSKELSYLVSFFGQFKSCFSISLFVQI